MKKFLLILILTMTTAVFAAGELCVADATGGAPLSFLMRASIELSLQETMNLYMQRITPTAALKELDNGTVDAVIVDLRFAKNRPFVPLCAEALALYVSSANPGARLTVKQVQEILFAHEPTWKSYNNLPLDIQRVMLNSLAPSGTRVRRVFGNKVFDSKIFKVDSMSAGFSFSNSASIFFAGYTPGYPQEIKCLYIDDIPPTTSTITDGSYPLALHYGIVYRKKTPELEMWINFISSEKYRNEMKNAGLFVLLPEIIGVEKR